MVASPLPAFLLDIATGPGIEVSREGAATRIDIVAEALSTSGVGNVFRVETGNRLKSLRGGVGLLIQANRTNTGPATLVVDGVERPLLDAGGDPQIANRIIEGRFYQVLFDAGTEAWRVQAGASTLDEIPGLVEAEASATAAAEVATTKAAQVRTDADAVSIAASDVEAARAEIAVIAPAVQADRVVVIEARADTQAASAEAIAARDQANSIAATQAPEYPTVAALPASGASAAIVAAYVTEDGVANGRYARASATAPWVKTRNPTVPGIAAGIRTARVPRALVGIWKRGLEALPGGMARDRLGRILVPDLTRRGDRPATWKGGVLPLILDATGTRPIAWLERAGDAIRFRALGLISPDAGRPVPLAPDMATAWAGLTQWTPTITVYDDPVAPSASVGITPESLFELFSPALSAPAATYYVSPAGSDSADGLTAGTAFRSIGRAIQAAKTAGATSVRVYVTAGSYPWANGVTLGGTVSLSGLDIALVATGGTVTTGTWDDYATPIQDATYPACWSWPLADADRVVDLKGRTRFGCYAELLPVASAAICATIPGSWAIESGRIYVRPVDGAAVTRSRYRVYRNRANVRVSEPISLYVGGQTFADRWALEGGDADGVLATRFGTPSAASVRAIVLSGLTARYGAGNGVAIDSHHGLAAAFGCDASANGTDGWNWHRFTSSLRTYALMVNCTGHDAGRGAYESNNGVTTHDGGLYLIDLAGVYRGNRGGSAAHVGSPVVQHVASVVADDLGDILLGGAVPPTAIRAANSASVYLDAVTIDMPGGAVAIRQADTAQVRTRGMRPRRSPDIGTVGTY